jgi:glycosyltransferase involved in cell wall biosynthesis
MITVVIPSISPRARLLNRARASVEAQEMRPSDMVVALDLSREGAAETRQRGLEQVKTPWVAFLDDDDEFLPGHLLALSRAAHEQQADYVFSWYEVVGGTDPRPEEFGLPWDPENPRQTTITTLVRTELALEVGGFVEDGDDLLSPDRYYAGEDWRFTKRINDAGGKIYHHPEKTWLWHHHGRNTSGLPNRW